MTANHVVLGTGAIGRAIMDELVKRGETVCMVNQSGKMDEVLAGVEVVASDLYDPARVKDVTRGAKVVYQCAQPRYYEWPKKFPALQKSILDGLTGSGAKLVIAENLYMFGDTDGVPITENLPYNAHTRKGKVRAELSEAALAAHRDGKVPVTIGRGADFFGPWATISAYGSRVFSRLMHGKDARIALSAKMPHTLTYIPDLGKSLVILGERTEADGQAWHVPNDLPRISQGEMIQMIAEEAGVEAKVMVTPKLMFSMLGLFDAELKEIIEMLYMYEKPFVVDSSKFEKTFGMKATSRKEAIKETVKWFKSHPEIK